MMTVLFLLSHDFQGAFLIYNCNFNICSGRARICFIAIFNLIQEIGFTESL